MFVFMMFVHLLNFGMKVISIVIIAVISAKVVLGQKLLTAFHVWMD